MAIEQIEQAYKSFYNKEYKIAFDIFEKNGLFYEAGFSSLMLKEYKTARECFNKKASVCPASEFGLFVLDIIEDLTPKKPKYFQLRSFLEIYINLFIENKHFDEAQKLIDGTINFINTNIEVPKFIARVLEANGYYNAVLYFADIAKRVCFYDAEIHFIEALVCIKQKKYEQAKKAIENCLSFAGEYYPILKLKNKLNPIVD